MRHCIRSLVRSFIETHRLPDPVLEIGSLQVSSGGVDADMRPLLPGRRFFGLDLRAGPGVDGRADAHALGIATASVGTILSLDALEHVEDPRRAVEEFRRVLAPGGVALLTSTMRFPIHEHPADYWRFTPSGMGSLLRPFAARFVGHAGEEDFPHVVFGIGYVEPSGPPPAFRDAYERWRREWHRAEWGRSWRDWVRPFVPPAVPWLWRAVKRAGRRRR
jgi:SAM-dependent methyltransferase